MMNTLKHDYQERRIILVLLCYCTESMETAAGSITLRTLFNYGEYPGMTFASLCCIPQLHIAIQCKVSENVFTSDPQKLAPRRWITDGIAAFTLQNLQACSKGATDFISLLSYCCWAHYTISGSASSCTGKAHSKPKQKLSHVLVTDGEECIVSQMQSHSIHHLATTPAPTACA